MASVTGTKSSEQLGHRRRVGLRRRAGGEREPGRRTRARRRRGGVCAGWSPWVPPSRSEASVVWSDRHALSRAAPHGPPVPSVFVGALRARCKAGFRPGGGRVASRIIWSAFPSSSPMRPTRGKIAPLPPPAAGYRLARHRSRPTDGGAGAGAACVRPITRSRMRVARWSERIASWSVRWRRQCRRGPGPGRRTPPRGGTARGPSCFREQLAPLAGPARRILGGDWERFRATLDALDRAGGAAARPRGRRRLQLQRRRNRGLRRRPGERDAVRVAGGRPARRGRIPLTYRAARRHAGAHPRQRLRAGLQPRAARLRPPAHRPPRGLRVHRALLGRRHEHRLALRDRGRGEHGGRPVAAVGRRGRVPAPSPTSRQPAPAASVAASSGSGPASTRRAEPRRRRAASPRRA